MDRGVTRRKSRRQYQFAMNFGRRMNAELPVATAYFAAAAISLTLARLHDGVPFLWLPASIMIAALRVRRRPDWPPLVAACAVAIFLASSLFGRGIFFAFPVTLINMAEGVSAGLMLDRLRRNKSPLGSLGWVLEFVIPVGIVGPGVSAGLMLGIGTLAGFNAQMLAIELFCAHSLGNLAFTPLTRLVALGGLRSVRDELLQHGWVELFCLLLITGAVSLLVFNQQALPLLFVTMLPMIFVAFRLGFAGSVLGVLIISAVGGYFTVLGLGPIQLIHGDVDAHLRFAQFYLGTIVLTVLPVAADLRNRMELLRAMQLSEQRYRLIADHSSDMIMHLELDGSIRYASPSMKQITGFDPETLIGTPARNLVPIDQRPILHEGHLATLAARGATHSIEYIALTQGGGRIWLESRARMLMDEHGEIESTLCIVRDVSARKEKELRLTEAAMTDPLTGLPNRRGFAAAVEDLRHQSQSGQPDCIAMLDIDRFKRVNDRFGHDAGDAVLREFARVLGKVVRSGDVIGRLGGEEFAVLFPATAIPQALMICERLREEFGRTVTEVGGIVITVTVSGGVALLGDQELEAALKQADQALYAAKRGGRDQMALAA